MSPVEWTRSVSKPRLRAALPIAGGVLGTAAFVLGAIVGRGSAPRVVVPVAAPLHIAVPAAPPAQIVVTPSTTPPPPPPPPAPEPAPPPPPPAPPPPRATRPQIAVQCLLTVEGQAEDPMCSWDDGFPAISGDGAQIATKYIPDDAGRGYFGESIRFLDVGTGRVVRTAVLLSPEENDPGHPSDQLRATVAARAAAVQRELDAGKFRSLIALGGHDFRGEGGEDSHTDTTKIHADFAGSAVRIVDPSTNTEIGRHVFGVASPHAPDVDGTEMCSGWGIRWLAVWWDPATRTLLGSSEYRTGGCMCPDETVDQIDRLPPS